MIQILIFRKDLFIYFHVYLGIIQAQQALLTYSSSLSRPSYQM